MLPPNFRTSVFKVGETVLVEHLRLDGEILEVDNGKRSSVEPVYLVETVDGARDWFVQTHLDKKA